MSEKCLVGKNGFLFLNNDSNDVIKQHTGELLLSECNLHQWSKTLESRKKYFQDKQIPYFIQLSPDKHQIYKENLPEDIILSDNRPSLQFEKLIELNGLSDYYLNPLSFMRDRKKNELVCHKTDTHWNARGAYIAYQQFITAVKEIYPSIEVCKEKYIENERAGDLGSKMTPIIKSNFVDSWLKKDNNLIYYNEVENTGALKVFENKRINNKFVCIVFGSSSANDYYVDYLSESFHKVYFIWEQAVDFSIFKHVKADVVLSQIRERFLIRPVNDFLNLSFIDKTIIKTMLESNKVEKITKIYEILGCTEYKTTLTKTLTDLYMKCITSKFVDKKYVAILYEILKNNGFLDMADKLLNKYRLDNKTIEYFSIYEKEKIYAKNIKTKIISSGLFDESFYLNRYPDVAKAQVDPFNHYMNTGWKEGRNPSKEFITKSYLEENPGIREKNICPLTHLFDTVDDSFFDALNIQKTIGSIDIIEQSNIVGGWGISIKKPDKEGQVFVKISSKFELRKEVIANLNRQDLVKLKISKKKSFGFAFNLEKLGIRDGDFFKVDINNGAIRKGSIKGDAKRLFNEFDLLEYPRNDFSILDQDTESLYQSNSDLLTLKKILIRLRRCKRGIASNTRFIGKDYAHQVSDWQLFKRIVEENIEVVCSFFNIRYLHSIVATYADFGEDIERACALSVSNIIFQERFAQTLRCIYDFNKKESLLDQQMVWPGLRTNSLSSDDAYQVFLGRQLEVLSMSPVILSIFKEIFTRMYHNDKSIVGENINNSKSIKKTIDLYLKQF